MRIFFAGPLTELKDPDKTKAFYKKLEAAAQAVGWATYWAFERGTDPELNPHVPASRVYQIDTYELEVSDIVVAYVGETSTGTGIELEYAREHHVPVYLIFEQGKHISRMILGSPIVKGTIEFTDEDDACKKLQELLASLTG